MAILGPMSAKKRPQQTTGLMLGVPFRGLRVAKAWPRKRKFPNPIEVTAHHERMIVINWLSKFMAPCQSESIMNMGKDLHMRPRDLASQILANRMFAPTDKNGTTVWPKQFRDDVNSAMGAIGTADGEIMFRDPVGYWRGTNWAGPTNVLWCISGAIIQFSNQMV